MKNWVSSLLVLSLIHETAFGPGTAFGADQTGGMAEAAKQGSEEVKAVCGGSTLQQSQLGQ